MMHTSYPVSQRRRFGAFAIAVGAITLASCQSLSYTAEGGFSAGPGRPVILTRTVFMADLRPPFEVDLEAFDANLFVGRVVFSGGVIRDSSKGNIYRSARLSLEEEAAYRASIGDVVYGAALRGLRGLSAGGLDADAPAERIAASLARRSSVVPRDERFLRVDSVNVPYREYSVALVPGSIEALRAACGASTGVVLIPVVERGYSHTAGWFNDQESGCLAGVRLTVQLYGIDLDSGATAFRFTEDFRVVDDFASVLSEFAIAERLESIGDALALHIEAAIGKR